MFAKATLGCFKSLSTMTGCWRRMPVLPVMLAGLFGLSPALAEEGGFFRADDVVIELVDGEYLLDGSCSIGLAPGARDALENNVPLVFEVQIQLVRKHRWLWDTVENETRHARRLEFHALSRSYVVSERDTGRRASFRRLEDALRAAGNLRNVPLVTSQQLETDGDYEIRLRGSLDIESLPTPVRLLAYASSAWDMESEWYAWPLVR